MRRRGRWAAAIAALLLTLAIVLSYAGRAFLRAGPFADRAVAVLRSEPVRADVADHLTSAIIRAGNGNLDAVRPLIRPIAGAVVSSQPFAALLHRGLLEAHRALVGGGGTVFVNVADAGVLIEGVLSRLAPEAARRVDSERVVRLLSIHPGSFVKDVVWTAHQLYVAARVLAVIALLIGAALLWRSADRRVAARRLGVGGLIGGVVVVAVYVVGGAVAGQLAPPGRGAAVRAVWHGFLHGLYIEALMLAAAGAVVVALAAGGARRASAAGLLADARAVLGGGAIRSRRQALASLALVIAGLAILLEPGPALTLAALAAGLYIFALGVHGLVRLTSHAPSAARGVSAAATATGRRARRYVAPTVALVLVAVAITIALTGAADEAPAVAAPGCNGYVALCDRPLNDVSFAATHNSMASVTIPSWLFGQQDGTISDQLSGGIRGLLIDSYHGEAIGNRVRTDLESLPKREVAVAELGAPATEAALRIRARLARGGPGQRGIFLCHGFCELGAVTLASALHDVREFLVSRPSAVVVIVNQDEGVTPDDIARAFDQAGLLDLVYRRPLGPFPTLRAMIDSGQRLVVMAENDAGTIPWYHVAYEHALQETPFRFTATSQLTAPANLPASCRPNRGPASAPLFLLNHWIDTTPVPRASLAAIVNARQALLARATTCQRIRHRLPNLVAVDFYRRGDVLGVVNTLNGISSSAK